MEALALAYRDRLEIPLNFLTKLNADDRRHARMSLGTETLCVQPPCHGHCLKDVRQVFQQKLAPLHSNEEA